VHLEDLPEPGPLADETLLAEWEPLLAAREVVNAALEQKRKDKVIGTSLGARVAVTASGPVAQLLERYRSHLPMLFIVSDVALHVGAAEGADTVAVDVEKAPGEKCGRCWRFVPAVRTEPEWAGICDRCVDALAESPGGRYALNETQSTVRSDRESAGRDLGAASPHVGRTRH
jgi:isoleucyl-tRNA synthetase